MRLFKSLYKHMDTSFGLIMLMLFIIIPAGCGGGGGDDVVDVDPVVPDVLTYEIRQSEDASLTVTQAELQAIIAPVPTRTLLSGTYNRLTEAFTLDSLGPVMFVNASDFLASLDAALADGASFSNYLLQVNTAAAWVGDGNPSSGEFEIRGQNDPVRKITVTVNPAGVDIVYSPNVNPPVNISLTWNEFDEYFDNGVEAYGRIASFAYSVLRFMYEQGDNAISSLEYLDENDTLLQQQGSITEDCDIYPSGLVPPPVSNPGTSIFTWTDDTGNADVGPGDSFRWDLTECWDNDASDDFDLLFDGVIKLNNYTEVVDANNVVTRIGFDSFGGVSGVVYENLVLTETETTSTNVLLDPDAMTLNGGFSMIFSSP